MSCRMLLSVVGALVLFVAASSTSAATIGAPPIAPGVAYQVLDHPDGSLGPPAYALRLDGLDGNPGNDFVFSAEMGGAALNILFNDNGDGSILISGTVYGGLAVGDDFIAPQLWAVSFLYSEISDFGGVLEAVPGSGSGTITALGTIAAGGGVVPTGGFGAGQVIGLVDKANSSGLAFRLDFGHRTDDDTVTGHGWLTHDAAPRTSSQDWLFTVGTPIPEPGTALLMGFGLAALSSTRGRRDVQ